MLTHKTLLTPQNSEFWKKKTLAVMAMHSRTTTSYI